MATLLGIICGRSPATSGVLCAWESVDTRMISYVQTYTRTRILYYCCIPGVWGMGHVSTGKSEVRTYNTHTIFLGYPSSVVLCAYRSTKSVSSSIYISTSAVRSMMIPVVHVGMVICIRLLAGCCTAVRYAPYSGTPFVLPCMYVQLVIPTPAIV